MGYLGPKLTHLRTDAEPHGEPMKNREAGHEQIAAGVMAIDVDDLTLGRLKAALRGTEFTVGRVSREEALRRVPSEEGPVILLLEWEEDGAVERAALCQALRGVARADRFYVVALGGPAAHAALLHATEGPANDALSRPFDRELLLVCLRQGVRTMQAAVSAVAPRAALDEALLHGRGEVCVRAGDTVARIHVQDGHIVWANLSSSPSTIEEVVAHGGVTLDAEVIAAVKHECRATSAHFMDVLIKWGLIDEEHAREAVRSFVTDRVSLILDLPGAKALFLPAGPLRHSERMRFSASEILSLKLLRAATVGDASVEPSPESRRTPALSVDALSDIVKAAMRTPGAIGAAVLERGTGVCLRHAGVEPDTQVAWSQVSALAALGPGAEEVLACAGDHCFITRPLRGAPSLMLFVCVSLSAITLGLARAAIALLAAHGAAPAAGPGTKS